MTIETRACRVNPGRGHYATQGKNASIVFEAGYVPAGRARSKRVEIQARAGRRDLGEWVQVEISIKDQYANTSRETFASLSFNEADWLALIEHTKHAREIARDGTETILRDDPAPEGWRVAETSTEDSATILPDKRHEALNFR